MVREVEALGKYEYSNSRRDRNDENRGRLNAGNTFCQSVQNLTLPTSYLNA
jgi:hypothetical protein